MGCIRLIIIYLIAYNILDITLFGMLRNLNSTEHDIKVIKNICDV